MAVLLDIYFNKARILIDEKRFGSITVDWNRKEQHR
jgi:hypothetical protein